MLAPTTLRLKRQVPREYRPASRSRGTILTKLRQEVMVLQVIGCEHAAVARVPHISEEDVSALSNQRRRQEFPSRLTRRAVNALLHGRYAPIGGRTVPQRARHLAEIASAYSGKELLTEPGVGQVTALEIERWLESKGLTFRCDDMERTGE